MLGPGLLATVQDSALWTRTPARYRCAQDSRGAAIAHEETALRSRERLSKLVAKRTSRIAALEIDTNWRMSRRRWSPLASLNQFTETKPKSRYDRMNRRRHGAAQALYSAGLLRPRCAVT